MPLWFILLVGIAELYSFVVAAIQVTARLGFGCLMHPICFTRCWKEIPGLWLSRWREYALYAEWQAIRRRL